MIAQNTLQILQYNIRHEALSIMTLLLQDHKILEFDILAIQES